MAKPRSLVDWVLSAGQLVACDEAIHPHPNPFKGGFVPCKQVLRGFHGDVHRSPRLYWRDSISDILAEFTSTPG